MIEIEGVLVERPGGRLRGAGMMSVEVTLSPWRRRGAGTSEPGVVRVSLEVDVDLADAWLSDLDASDCVRIGCRSVTEAAHPGAEARAEGTALIRQPRPPEWDTPRPPLS